MTIAMIKADEVEAERRRRKRTADPRDSPNVIHGRPNYVRWGCMPPRRAPSKYGN
tara:strand:- start:309 stop:473 length:165 start_codon:yes stop_codon:yes gene_type:complete